MDLQTGQVVGYKKFPRSFTDEAIPAKVIGPVEDMPMGKAWELEVSEGQSIIAYEPQILTTADGEEAAGDWDTLSKTAVALLGQMGVLAVRVTVKGEISGDILVDRDSMGEFVRLLRRLSTGE